jgi:hypothetical protein
MMLVCICSLQVRKQECWLHLLQVVAEQLSLLHNQFKNINLEAAHWGGFFYLPLRIGGNEFAQRIID